MTDDHEAGGTTATDGGARDEIQQALATIWCGVLNLPDVGGDALFVELGGDSIAATLCVNHIRRFFNCDIDADAMLADDMTFARLVALVRAEKTASPPA